MAKKKRVLLLTPMALPVPAVGGGAVESLITGLLEENERQGRAKFIVISKDDPQVRRQCYKHSKIYCLWDHRKLTNAPWMSLLMGLLLKCYFLWLKVVRNHPVYGSYPEMNAYEFQCYWIARLHRVDAIVSEGRWDESCCARLGRIVGRDNLYIHIHCERPEELPARRAFPNSISISGYVRDCWAVTPGLPGEHDVLYNGIDVDRFAVSVEKEERTQLRQQYGVQEWETLVLFCGRIVPEKGVEPLLDAFDFLTEKPVKLLMVGNVDFSTNTVTDFSGKMMLRAEKMPNVIPTGYLPNEDLPKLYAIADIVVIPSICQEGAGLVAIEAMASGKPVISTISGGMVEYLSPEASIQLPIDEALPRSIADAVVYLMEHPDAAEQMGQKGAERSRQFSYPAYYRNFMNIMEKRPAEF